MAKTKTKMQAKRKIASPAQPEPAQVFLQQRLKNNQDHKRQQKDQKQSPSPRRVLVEDF